MTTIDNFWQQLKEKQHKFELKKAQVRPEYLLADENIEIREGGHHKIPVKKLKVPANHLVFTSLYMMNKKGNVSGVGEASPKPMGVDRSIEHIKFHASTSGKINKGEFLGYVLVIPLGQKL